MRIATERQTVLSSAATGTAATTQAVTADATTADRRFTSSTRLFGEAAMRRLWQGHAVVVGIGGVGSWAAEALARSGVGRITLIDLDQIAESNINRQVHALESTVGAAKVTVMAERLRAISPHAQVHAVEEFVEVAEPSRWLPEQPGVVIDAIDAVAAKAGLVAWCVASGVPVITCGAAGGRRDPLKLAADDLAWAHGDSLLASLRTRLRREHGFPAAAPAVAGKAPRFGVTAIYSPESLGGARPDDPAQTGLAGGAPLACAGYGSIVTVTASMGFAAASRAMDLLMATATAPVRS